MNNFGFIIARHVNSEKTNRYYAGVDIGRVDDYTVVSIFNDIGRMLYGLIYCRICVYSQETVCWGLVVFLFFQGSGD